MDGGEARLHCCSWRILQVVMTSAKESRKKKRKINLRRRVLAMSVSVPADERVMATVKTRLIYTSWELRITEEAR
jgi:hypothetical protein